MVKCVVKMRDRKTPLLRWKCRRWLRAPYCTTATNHIASACENVHMAPAMYMPSTLERWSTATPLTTYTLYTYPSVSSVLLPPPSSTAAFRQQSPGYKYLACLLKLSVLFWGCSRKNLNIATQQPPQRHVCVARPTFNNRAWYA